MSGVQQKANSRHITWLAMFSSFSLHHFSLTAQAATWSDTVQQQQAFLCCRYHRSTLSSMRRSLLQFTLARCLNTHMLMVSDHCTQLALFDGLSSRMV